MSLWAVTLSQAYANTTTESNTWSELETAKKYYEEKQYDTAFQELFAHPRETSAYFYNLGTLSFKMGKIGRAVAYLEKGYHLSPDDADIQYNLSIAKNALAAQLGIDQLDPASSWVEKLADRVTLEQARATLGLMGLILALLWIRAYLNQRSLKKAVLNSAALIGFFSFAITLAVYGIQRFAEGTPPAFCLEKDSIRSGPGAHYMELARIEAGTKVRFLSQKIEEPAPTSSLQMNVEKPANFWIQVRYSPEGIGWIRASGLLTL